VSIDIGTGASPGVLTRDALDREVEVVHDAAAQRLTEQCGGIGAVLRFRAG
jgi:hypothetical protein